MINLAEPPFVSFPPFAQSFFSPDLQIRSLCRNTWDPVSAGLMLLIGGQTLYGDYGFSVGPGTSSSLGSGDGGNPIGWFPDPGIFFIAFNFNWKF